MLARDVLSPLRAADSETISISIGVGSDTRASSSIVLPRGHDLVKHLERLLPQIAQAATTQQQRQQSVAAALDAAIPSLAPHSSTMYNTSNNNNNTVRSHMMDHRHHPYSRSLPQSPYQSDSSHGSAPSSSSLYDLPTPSQQQTHTGVRRRRGAGASQAAGKKCQFPNCEKISVSRGLCRGHGGGRRCQHAGCSKGAQSRSDFCWAHGGGQRCEVKNCMRSRKSKRFCVAHLSWETAPASSDGSFLDGASMGLSHHLSYQQQQQRVYEQPKTIMPKPLAPYPDTTSAPVLHFPSLATSGKLPSLQQALQKNQCVGAAAVTSRPAFVHHHHLHHPTPVLNSASG